MSQSLFRNVFANSCLMLFVVSLGFVVALLRLRGLQKPCVSSYNRQVTKAAAGVLQQ